MAGQMASRLNGRTGVIDESMPWRIKARFFLTRLRHVSGLRIRQGSMDAQAQCRTDILLQAEMPSSAQHLMCHVQLFQKMSWHSRPDNQFSLQHSKSSASPRLPRNVFPTFFRYQIGICAPALATTLRRSGSHRSRPHHRTHCTRSTWLQVSTSLIYSCGATAF
jgi:hypothetical protein